MQNVCYERINDAFSYGQYLTFKVVINTKTGYVNATKLCNDYDKRFSNWTPLSTTQQLIKSFNVHPDADGWLSKSQSISSHGILWDENSSDLEKSKNENQNATPVIQGTASNWMKVEKGGDNVKVLELLVGLIFTHVCYLHLVCGSHPNFTF